MFVIRFYAACDQRGMERVVYLTGDSGGLAEVTTQPDLPCLSIEVTPTEFHRLRRFRRKPVSSKIRRGATLPSGR